MVAGLRAKHLPYLLTVVCSPAAQTPAAPAEPGAQGEFEALRCDAPLKLSFSSAEWCGHVYEELDLGPKGVELDLASYFQGESVRKTLPAKAGGIVGEQLFEWLRGRELPDSAELTGASA